MVCQVLANASISSCPCLLFMFVGFVTTLPFHAIYVYADAGFVFFLLLHTSLCTCLPKNSSTLLMLLMLAVATAPKAWTAGIANAHGCHLGVNETCVGPHNTFHHTIQIIQWSHS